MTGKKSRPSYSENQIKWWQNEARELYLVSRMHRREGNRFQSMMFARQAAVRSMVARNMVAANMGVDPECS